MQKILKIPEILLSGLFETSRRWTVNLLDAMTFTDEGLYGLPFEIWHKIFTEATIASSGDFDSTVIDPSAPPRMLMYERPALLANFESWKEPGPYKTRRSLTLVCKSWYFVANPMLWSNIRVDLRCPSIVIKELCSLLGRNKGLSECVVGITIRGLDWTYPAQGEDAEIDEEIKKLRPFNKIFPNLTKLKMISCPRSIVERVDWLISPNVVMIYEKVNWMETGGPLGYRSAFWNHCHTLILTHTAFTYLANPSPGPNTSLGIAFHSLINLRIRQDNDMNIIPIATTWKFPVLRLLSVTSTGAHVWARLFDQVRLTLEHLEIAIAVAYRTKTPSTIPPITMPNLTTLCLQDGTAVWEGHSTLWWVSYITAPRLRKVVFHPTRIPNTQSSFYKASSHWTLAEQAEQLVPKIEAALARYPTVQELGIVIEDYSEERENEKKGLLSLICRDDVESWRSQGIMVEAIDQATGLSYPLTPDDPRLKSSPLA